MTVAESARTDGGIRLQGLAKTFRGPHGPIHAVGGIDASIAAGETVALLGPTGAGKSTTIDMLLGLAKPDAGTVSVLGRAPRDAVDAGLVGAMLRSAAAQRTQKLSGGQTQRVRFAVALVSNPDLLVLDEPTAAMDVEGRRDFWVIMRVRGPGADDPVRDALSRGGPCQR